MFQVWNDIGQLRTESLSAQMSHKVAKQLKEFESLISQGYIGVFCVYHWVNTQQHCGECKTISAHCKIYFFIANYFSHSKIPPSIILKRLKRKTLNLKIVRQQLHNLNVLYFLNPSSQQRDIFFIAKTDNVLLSSVWPCTAYIKQKYSVITMEEYNNYQWCYVWLKDKNKSKSLSNFKLSY